MQQLCKLIRNNDCEDIPEDERVWCLQTPYADGAMRFCTGEYFGAGEGNAIAEIKRVQRGGITCKNCLNHIQQIKSVRL